MNSKMLAQLPLFSRFRFPDASQASSLFPRTRQSYFSEMICARLGLNSGSRVLDIGCRTGFNVLQIACVTGAQVVGVDENPKAVREAIRERRTLEDPWVNTQFIVERPEQLPFASDGFDLVYCERFQDTANDLGAVSEAMVDLVKPTGKIVLSSLYLRRNTKGCEGELTEWLGESHQVGYLGEVIDLFESQGMVLNHFESFDDYLAAYVESMLWGSLLESGAGQECDWGKPLSWGAASSLLKSIDERDLGYAALVFEKVG